MTGDREREQAYRDVLVTVIEGGSTWASFRRIQRVRDIDGAAGDYISFEMRDSEDSMARWQKVDVGTVQAGIDAILSGGCLVNRSIRGAVVGLKVDPVNADVDAEAADCIIQAGLFGEIVFS